jgi:hypothetical protein
VEDPYNGSTDTRLDNLLLDDSKVPPVAIVRFGPGVFQTKGFGGKASVFQVKDRQRYVGAGVHQTTLQLVKAEAITEGLLARVFIFSTGVTDGQPATVEGLEISSMTLDANLSRQPRKENGDINNFLRCDCIELRGKNIRIRNVRCIDWGTYTPLSQGESHGSECFPIFVEGRGANGTEGENIVEDVVVEQPALNQGRETTMINVHALYDYLNIYSTTRNNYLNADFTTGSPPLPIRVVSAEYIESNTKIKIRTRWPHRVQMLDDVVFSGSPVSTFNDRFNLDIEQFTDSEAYVTFKFTKPAAISGTPDLNSATLTMQRYVPQAMIIPNASISRSGQTVTVTTPVAHMRRSGEFVRISGVLVNGSTDNKYNGSFAISGVTGVTSTQFTYQMDDAPGAPTRLTLIVSFGWIAGRHSH